jgi:hypothetical protein
MPNVHISSILFVPIAVWVLVNSRSVLEENSALYRQYCEVT